MEEDGLVCTVSTVRDTPVNVGRFVERNLSAGADHMFVFLDQPDPEVRAVLADHPHVTAVTTNKGYWNGQRPVALNPRQHVNANLANVVLTAVPRARWLFHLDGDECLHLDRDRLMALDPSVDVVRLGSWEAVSRVRWDGPVTVYKRPLDDQETALLRMLGVLGTGTPARSHFHGHVHGKVGLRPRLELKLAIHRVEGPDGAPVDAFSADWLRVLHDESYSGEEFVRKWLVWVTDSGDHRRDPFKQELEAAVAAVAANRRLDDDGKRAVLMDLFVRHVQDDEATLDRLGFLERPDERWHHHEPQVLQDAERATIDELLERLRGVDKSHFRCGRRGRPATGLLG